MAPRKASDAPAAEPRRSGRIASQPAVPVPEKAAPKPKAPKATKKRSAEALDEAKDGEATAAKKVKADSDDPDAAAPAATEEAPASAEAEGSNAAAESEPKQLEIAHPSKRKGEDVKVAELGAEKGVILFLVPKADTPGCTTQACGFRDSYPDFTSLNYDVYCLSADTPTAQSKWQTKKELPYPLLSDPKRLLITALGAGAGGKTKRSHFIFAKGGKLVEKKLPVTPADSPKLALAFIKSQTE